MVGTSPDEIRQTYKLKAQTDRLDKVQEQMWLARGLDSHGNPQVSA
jgi:hypothetical protein